MTPVTGRMGPDEQPERQPGTRQPSGGQGASGPTHPLLPALWLSRQPAHLSPLWRQVRTHPGQENDTLSFERTCAECRALRTVRGLQHCGRCGRVTDTLLRWMEFRSCVRCGRDTRIVEPTCKCCRRQLVAAHYRERAERRDGQRRLY